jgi:acetylornithine deacetylase
VTGEEAPAQEVAVGGFEGLGLDPDVWEPDVEELRGHGSFFETSSFVEVGYEGRPNVAATLEGGGEGRTLTLSGHVDVVSVDPDAWSTDPWTLVRDGDTLYGRGAADMKGGIAAYLTAVRASDAVGVELAGDLILQTTIEEEDGGVGGVLSALERGYRPDAAVVAVPNVGVASGGVMYFRVTVPGRPTPRPPSWASTGSARRWPSTRRSRNWTGSARPASSTPGPPASTRDWRGTSPTSTSG